MSERTRVPVGECRCPGAPHPEDWVEMFAEVPVVMGFAVMGIVREGPGGARLTALLSRAYIEYGIERWSFVDADGEPIPIEPEMDGWEATVARLLPWDKGGMEVGETGDRLYSAGLLRPLERRTLKSLPGGQTDGSISPTRPLQPSRRKRSRPSSRTITAGSPSGDPAP